MQELGTFPWRIAGEGVGVGQDGTEGTEEEWKKGREREIYALGLDTSCLTELYFLEEEYMLSLVIV